ncbi:MAG: hypothetical protein OEU09_18705 [Rhodospirillales bacterium]|nr:hypothetical protein [Rhodospirillales bacterium]MDH3913316.1 hypothetical protein [Rhodospirillales bacterium]MDH3918765.1 hypothetical protein [Rhodospirillales bacterium]MDH3969616.1 hypothetical protein [Rhodospirillales bacterium]
MTSQAATCCTEAPQGAPPETGRALADGPCAPDRAPGPAAGARHGDREAMLAEQMAACHRVVLDCLGRAGRAGDAEAARHGELRLAARFMALFLRQSGALDRHRDHLRRAREAEEQAGRDSLNRQVSLAAAQGRGLAQGFEASLRRFEQAARERSAAATDREAGAPPGTLAAPAEPAQPGAEDAATPPDGDPADPAPYPRGDDLEGWIETFAAPPRRAGPAPAEPAPNLTRQQRRAAKRLQEKAARSTKAG